MTQYTVTLWRNAVILFTLICAMLSISAHAQQRIVKHAGHFDIPSCNGQKLVEFETRQAAKSYAAKYCAVQQKQETYLCGAMTKKGSSCKRHVKHLGERCWQHRDSKPDKPRQQGSKKKETWI